MCFYISSGVELITSQVYIFYLWIALAVVLFMSTYCFYIIFPLGLHRTRQMLLLPHDCPLDVWRL